MNLADAVASVKATCDTSSWPTVSDDDVTTVVNGCRRVDAAGTTADDPAWVPTWELNEAAARVWELRAGRAATSFDFTTDGNTYYRSQVAAACRAQAKACRARAGVQTAPLIEESDTAALGYVWPWTVY